MELDWMLLANHAGALLRARECRLDDLALAVVERHRGRQSKISGLCCSLAGPVDDEARFIQGERGPRLRQLHFGANTFGDDVRRGILDDRAAHVIAPLNGLPLPGFGEYRIHLKVNNEHKGDLPFRVVRRF